MTRGPGRHVGGGARAVGGRAVRLRRASSGSRRWRSCSTSARCWPTSRCRPATGSPSSATPPRWACWSPTPSWRRGCELAHEAPVDIGADGTARRTSGAALQEAVDDDGVDAVVAVFLPPLMARLASSSARRCARWPATSAQADRRHVPVHRGHARRARRPRRRRHAGPRLGALVLHAGAGGDRAGQGRPSTPAGAAVRSASCPSCPTSTRPPAARSWSRRRWPTTPAGRDLTDDEAARPAGRLRRAAAGHPPGERRRGGGRRGRGDRLPGGAEVDRAVAAAPHRPGRRAAGPGRRRRRPRRVRRHPGRRPGDRAGDGRARGGHGGRGRRRPVVRRAGQLRRSAGWPPTCSATAPTARCR